MTHSLRVLILILVSLIASSRVEAAVVKTQSTKTLVLKLSPKELDGIVQGVDYKLHDEDGNMTAVLKIKKIFAGKGVIASIVSRRGLVNMNQRFHLEEMVSAR